jgi:hypothetical protein
MNMTEHDDGLPAAFTRRAEAAADQAAADAAALPVGSYRHRSQRECPDWSAVDGYSELAEQDMADDCALPDGDEFDHRKLCHAQVFDQLRFVGASEGCIVEMANRFVVHRAALTDHEIIRRRRPAVIRAAYQSRLTP